MSDQPAGDSMWLQESITVPDPLPNVLQEEPKKVSPCATSSSHKDESTPPRQKVDEVMRTMSQVASTAKEVELAKISFDPTSLAASAQRASSLRYSSARVPSMAGSSLVSAQEYDDLRLKYSKAKRELIRLSDIQKDLEYSRFELQKSQEEIKVVRESHSKMKLELEEAMHRADQDRRAKVAMEMKMSDIEATQEKEREFLKRQIEDLREEAGKRLQEMNEQQESEVQMRIESMRAEMSGLTMQMDTLVAQVEDTTAQKEELEMNLKNAAVELKNAELTISDLEKKLSSQKESCQALEKKHREYVSQADEHLEQQLRSQKTLLEEHAQQITAMKDQAISELKDELGMMSDKRRELEDEAANLRHKNSQLQEELTQIGAKHEKIIRRLNDDHQLAMSEKQLSLEAAIREAKGSRTAVDEENQSLHRQIVKANEELSTVATILAQREKQINVLEKDNDHLREVISHKEQEISQLTQQLEVASAAANDAAERASRFMAEKDEMEEAFEQDMRTLKDKSRALESNLMECRKELLIARKEQIETSDLMRTSTNDLRSQVSELTAECTALRLTVKQLRNGESEVEEIRRQLINEKRANEDLRSDLACALSRANQLEERGNERYVREKCKKSSRSPLPSSQTSLRPGNPNILSRAGSKRERPEDARVVAISGLDSARLVEEIKRLPNVVVSESKSNMPVPPNLTHLVTNGQLTIKLLSALVKGCWVLPEGYILESLKQREWLCEADFGFQHEILPLRHKKVFMTPAFVSSKNFNTATLLINEGNGVVVETEDEADMILCTTSDSSVKEKLSRNGPYMNWELFLDTIYPQRITC